MRVVDLGFTLTTLEDEGDGVIDRGFVVVVGVLGVTVLIRGVGRLFGFNEGIFFLGVGEGVRVVEDDDDEDDDEDVERPLLFDDGDMGDLAFVDLDNLGTGGFGGGGDSLRNFFFFDFDRRLTVDLDRRVDF